MAFLREPVVQFVLLGALLYGAATLRESRDEPPEIRITAEAVDGIAQRFARQFGKPPTAEELEWLIERHVRDEVFYREGVALGLAEGDEIVRRRIVQKMEFLSEGDGLLREPAPAELRAFYAANAARYARPAQVSFEQLYFSPDTDGETGARARAERALERLTRRSPDERAGGGDPFWERQHLERVDRRELERLFGRSELTAALFELPMQRWVGPLRSGVGWHLVRIAAREPRRGASFADVEADVRLDWQEAQRLRHRRAAFEALERRYRIVREVSADPAIAPAARSDSPPLTAAGGQ